VVLEVAAGGGGEDAVLTLSPTSAVRPLVPVSAPARVAGQPSATTFAPAAAIPLDGGWRFLADPDDVGIQQGWMRGGATNMSWTPVSVPNDFNPIVGRAPDHTRVGWYELRFTGPPVASGRSWSVAFESVRRHAAVWLNGTEIGTNVDPYAPFALPATTLYAKGPNVLIVRVDDVKPPGSLPEDWWNWGGIMGPVSLQPTGRLALDDPGVIPELHCGYGCGDLLVTGTLTNTSTTALSPAVRVAITTPGGSMYVDVHPVGRLAAGARTPISFRVPVRGPLRLWSPSSPPLYPVRLTVSAGGRIEQQRTFHVGMRSVQIRGGILFLNGTRLWLHGAAIHEDVQGRGAALNAGDIDTIVGELRSVGANITRAHYLLSERLLDALDAAGIMVWEQPPVDHADPELATPAGRTAALSLLRSTIVAARNHPSVVVDSIGNELTPTPNSTPGTDAYLSQASTLARQLSPTVPVALDIYCYPGFPPQQIYSKLDLLGISDYFGWYPGIPGHSIASFARLAPFLATTHARYPRQALVISEFGAEGLFDGTSTTKGSYEFQTNYLRRTLGLLDRLPFMSGSIYWTLREFAVAPGWRGGATLPPGSAPDGIHHKGLIAYDGTEKPAFALAEKLFATQPGFVR